MKWSDIFSLIWDKLFGGANRQKYLNKQTEMVIQGVWDLNREKEKLIENYRKQIEKIETHRSKHPDNGVELDQWKEREYKLMMDLVKAKEEINFWRERAIFIEKENELLLMREETGNRKNKI